MSISSVQLVLAFFLKNKINQIRQGKCEVKGMFVEDKSKGWSNTDNKTKEFN